MVPVVGELTDSCPKCKNQKTALILWGYMPVTDELQKKLNAEEIVLGGCLVTDHDPKWQCNKCLHQWGERDE